MYELSIIDHLSGQYHVLWTQYLDIDRGQKHDTANNCLITELKKRRLFQIR